MVNHRYTATALPVVLHFMACLQRMTQASVWVVSYFMLRNLLLQFGGLCSNGFCICKPLLCGGQPLHQWLQSFMKLLRYHWDAFQLTVPISTPRERLFLWWSKCEIVKKIKIIKKSLNTSQKKEIILSYGRNQPSNETEMYLWYSITIKVKILLKPPKLFESLLANMQVLQIKILLPYSYTFCWKHSSTQFSKTFFSTQFVSFSIF